MPNTYHFLRNGNLFLRQSLFWIHVLFFLMYAHSYGQTENLSHLQSKLQAEKDSFEKLKLQILLCRGYYNSFPDSTLYFAEEAISNATTLLSDPNHPKHDSIIHQSLYAYELKSYVLQYKGDLQNALLAAKQNYQGSMVLDDSTLLIASLSSLGLLYYYTDSISLAVSNWNRGNHIAELFRDTTESYYKSLMSMYNNQTVLYEELGDYGKAIDLYLKSLTLSEKLGLYEELIKANIANLMNKLEDYPQALQFANEAINQASEKNNKQVALYSLMIKGEIYSNTQQYDSAIQMFQAALEKLEQQNMQIYQKSIYANLAYVYNELNQTDRALTFALKTIPDDKSDINNLNFPLPDFYNLISNIYYKQGNYSEATRYAQLALTIAEERKTWNYAKDASQQLVQIYKDQGNLEKTITHMEKLMVFKDSVLNEKKIKEIEQTRYKYEITQSEIEKELLIAQQKQQEAELETKQAVIARQRIGGLGAIAFLSGISILSIFLYRSYRKQQSISTELAQLNQVKNKLFSVIAHDLKGPIDALYQLMAHYQSSQYNKKFNPDIYNYLYEKVGQTTNLLQNLLLWAKQQLKGEVYQTLTFNIKEEVLSVIELYDHSLQNKQIELQLDIAPELSIVSDPHRFRHIFQNLLSNAIKYSHKGDIIYVKAVKKGQLLLMEIQDNGIGIPKPQLEHLFSLDTYSRPGTDMETGTGLGLVLSKEYIEQLGGELGVKSEENAGSNFHFTLPIH